jgi:hypothetical protein
VNEINDILKELKAQAQSYIDLMLKPLELDLEQSARKYKAIERDGETSNAKLLFQLLLIYAISSHSLRVLSVYGYMMGFANVTDEALRQRFAKCGAWVCALLQIQLASLAPMSQVLSHNGQSMQVYLIDATTFKQVGKKGKELRAHMCYNLTQGRMEEVVVTDNHTAENVKSYTIKPGNLYMGDAGYGKGVNMELVSEQGGYALFRITPNLVKLANDSKGKDVIDMEARLKKAKRKATQITIHCYVHTARGRYVPVRIIASRLPKDKALLAKERKMRASKKKQTQIKEATLVYCQWVILMTNVDDSHSAESLLRLYRSRWQIELLFKRIKQFLKVKRLRKASLEHSNLLVMLWMFIWSVVEKKTLEVEIQLMEQGEDLSLYSLWSATALSFSHFDVMLNSLWAFSYEHTVHLSDVYRKLRNHKSRRRNQYSDFRFPDGIAVVISQQSQNITSDAT